MILFVSLFLVLAGPRYYFLINHQGFVSFIVIILLASKDPMSDERV